MCGIYGTSILDMKVLSKMADKLSHRGPESKHVWLGKHFMMGVNRLATIGQNVSYPIHYNQYHMIFNGDIYNYKELRKELKKYPFTTDSDGEVIVKGYHEWGDKVFTKLKGQFAVIIYDEDTEQVILARDRFGICPLYYTRDGYKMYIASELKAFKGLVPFKLNKMALYSYYNFDCVPAPETLIETIYKLEPGNIVKLPLTNDLTAEEDIFWTVKFTEPPQYPPVKEVRTLLQKSVEWASIADYPVGVYLSGGMDSSTVTAFMKNINPDNLHTFSVRFKSDTVKDETSDARKVAKHFKTIHHEVEIDESVLDKFSDVVWHMDEPIPNITAFAQFELSRLTRENGIKIVLDGSGGDELFGGYTYQNNLLPRLHKMKFLKLISPFLEIFSESNNKYLRKLSKVSKHVGDRADLYNALVHNGKEECGYILKGMGLFSGTKTREYVNEIIEADIRITLSNQYLHLGDRMAMAHGVICRCPLLDEELAKLAFSVSVRDKEDKWIMREAMEGILPDETIHKKKSGFVAPLKAWWPILEQKYGNLLSLRFKNPKGNHNIKRSFQELVLREWMRQYEVEE